MTDGSVRRYGVYFLPPADSPLSRVGAAWLGHDIETGAATDAAPPIRDQALPRARAELIERPAHYGFHATLKPPFRLAPGTDLNRLKDAAAEMAATHPRPSPTRLSVQALGGFVALRPAEPAPGLSTLAAACVEHLDPFRAPLDAADRAKRPAHKLTERQAALQEAWGYPYVFEEFRFHMTLSGRVDAGESDALVAVLSEVFAPALAEPIAFDEIALVAEPEAVSGGAAPFRLVSRHQLSAP